MELLTILVYKRPTAMLLTIFPTTVVALPSACYPLHLANAFSAVADELPNILHTVLPLHAAFSGHAIVYEAAFINRTICSEQVAFPICFAAQKLARVLGSLWPGHHSMTAPESMCVAA